MRNKDAVLGLSALGHDPAAALVVDGQLVAAVQEERLNRRKGTHAFPQLAIRHVLERGGLQLREVGGIAYYWNDWANIGGALLSARSQAALNPLGAAVMAGRRLRDLSTPLDLLRHIAVLSQGHHGSFRLALIDHHRAHLAAAWLSAPFTPEAALIVDGRGEVNSTSLYALRRGSPQLVEAYPFPNSLGVFYGAITQALGYRADSDEYKVMGLASYGEPDRRWQGLTARLLQIGHDGRYHLDVSALRAARWGRLIPPGAAGKGRWLTDDAWDCFAGDLREGDEFTEEGRNLAYAAQETLERALTGLLQRLVRLTGAQNVVLAGGVAMNAAAIGRLRRAGIVKNLHVPLAPGDAGTSVGAALEYLRSRGRAVPPHEQLLSPFLGPEFSPQQVEAALLGSGLSYRQCDVSLEAARAIASGRIIGWFAGRLEFGERSLGARSILGDPREARSRDRINASVKRREGYRPFAPAVLEEHATTYFDTGHARLMQEIVPVRAHAKRAVPAVVHTDGTARPQTVPRGWGVASFRRLLEHFHELTGVPLLINTSFNVRDEPIVCTPTDAINCFLQTDLDQLFIGPFTASKNP